MLRFIRYIGIVNTNFYLQHWIFPKGFIQAKYCFTDLGGNNVIDMIQLQNSFSLEILPNTIAWSLLDLNTVILLTPRGGGCLWSYFRQFRENWIITVTVISFPCIFLLKIQKTPIVSLWVSILTDTLFDNWLL